MAAHPLKIAHIVDHQRSLSRLGRGGNQHIMGPMGSPFAFQVDPDA